jgi:hypothetical protein
MLRREVSGIPHLRQHGRHRPWRSVRRPQDVRAGTVCSDFRVEAGLAPSQANTPLITAPREHVSHFVGDCRGEKFIVKQVEQALSYKHLTAWPAVSGGFLRAKNGDAHQGPGCFIEQIVAHALRPGRKRSDLRSSELCDPRRRGRGGRAVGAADRPSSEAEHCEQLN